MKSESHDARWRSDIGVCRVGFLELESDTRRRIDVTKEPFADVTGLRDGAE